MEECGQRGMHIWFSAGKHISSQFTKKSESHFQSHSPSASKGGLQNNRWLLCCLKIFPVRSYIEKKHF